MKILIVYETFEGQTRKIVDFVAHQIRSAGHDVQVFNTKDKTDNPSLKGVDKVVLAAPVHERRHPPDFELWVSHRLTELKARPTFLISISLKAAFPEGMEEAEDYLTEMKMRTGFEPEKEILTAGSVRTNSYGYFESQIVQNVLLAGHDVSLVDGEREFTDWAALGAELATFL